MGEGSEALLRPATHIPVALCWGSGTLQWNLGFQIGLKHPSQGVLPAGASEKGPHGDRDNSCFAQLPPTVHLLITLLQSLTPIFLFYLFYLFFGTKDQLTTVRLAGRHLCY